MFLCLTHAMLTNPAKLFWSRLCRETPLSLGRNQSEALSFRQVSLSSCCGYSTSRSPKYQDEYPPTPHSGLHCHRSIPLRLSPHRASECPIPRHTKYGCFPIPLLPHISEVRRAYLHPLRRSFNLPPSQPALRFL